MSDEKWESGNGWNKGKKQGGEVTWVKERRGESETERGKGDHSSWQLCGYVGVHHLARVCTDTPMGRKKQKGKKN